MVKVQMLLLGIWLSLLPTTVSADQCPVILKAEEIIPFGMPIVRHQLFAFRATQSSKGGLSWENFPLHLDPLDRNGKLDFSQGLKPWSSRLSPNDRLVLLNEDFVEQPDSLLPDQWPCEADAAYELRLAHDPKRKALLFLCRHIQNNFSSSSTPVKIDAEKRTINTETYQYTYRRSNQLLFDAISLRRGGKLYEVSTEADQLIYSDIKNFFTMRFGADDVEAKILDYRHSPLGLASRLSFFLRILFFRINLSLLPEAYYFKDSVYIPMVMHLPVHASDYLNFRSGVFFTWKTATEVRWDLSQSRMPTIDQYLAANSLGQLKSIAASFCQKHSCRFSAVAILPTNERVELIFSLRPGLIDRGFFPFFITDSTVLDKTWGRVSSFSGKRQGFFFETSGLGKGSHLWDFWIRFDALKQNASPATEISCPSQAIVRRLDAPKK